jgi:ligand-binding sensor domain-containing protein
MRLPQRIKDIHALAYSPDGTLWIGSGDGVYFSHDGGNNWFWLEKVPVRDVDDLSYDPGSGRMMATSRMSQVLYAVDPASLAFTGTWTGFRIFRARPAGKTRIAASIQDGVVVDPGHP